MKRNTSMMILLGCCLFSINSHGTEQGLPPGVTEKDLLNDLQKVIYFYQREYALQEKIHLYNKIEHKESRDILGCSIKHNLVDLKSYVDLDLPGELVVEASLITVTQIANVHWRWVTRNSDFVNLECSSLDSYWYTLVK